ncbi:Dynein regulatory complex subunit 3 [Nibea albiflora]|uniref:Dynein regulatory complex subunit 3 n=1 Tax=Nibea albiflora TaxID=240163 RepID=A0ACB7EXN7_NIBAL|nr:Dynein regulatory complex subunit 3 [Nibea albiflora]
MDEATMPDLEAKPVFMDEEMLHEAVMVQIPTYPRIENLEEIKYSEILRLQLEFRNIPKIQFLWEFTSLTRLDLNNNLIEKIEGLGCLVNLTWLTLSFNKIEKIEGLESLRKLELLNLTHNRIAVIENLDTLEKLTHLYIGSNCLEQLDDVLYLRKFETLFALTLSGNPLSKEDEYKYFIAAYFPKLMYLDYKLLDAKTKNEAAVKFHLILEKMKAEELQIQQAKETEQRQEDEAKLHKDAFVEFLNGSYMFKSMFKDDPEAEILPSVPGMADLLQTYPFSHTFAQCRDLEDNYYENARKIAATTLENIAKKDVEVELPEDVKLLFKTKETVMDALATGHDNHLQIIIDQETQLIMRTNIEDNELERNRMRTSTIHRYMNYLREQLEEFQ